MFEAAETNDHRRKKEDYFRNVSSNEQNLENQSFVKDSIIMVCIYWCTLFFFPRFNIFRIISRT